MKLKVSSNSKDYQVDLPMFILYILGFIFLQIYFAFIFSYSWAWFIVPVFHVQNISMALAYGIGIIPRLIFFPIKTVADATFIGLVKAKVIDNVVRTPKEGMLNDYVVFTSFLIISYFVHLMV